LARAPREAIGSDGKIKTGSFRALVAKYRRRRVIRADKHQRQEKPVSVRLSGTNLRWSFLLETLGDCVIVERA